MARSYPKEKREHASGLEQGLLLNGNFKGHDHGDAPERDRLTGMAEDLSAIGIEN